MTNHTIDRNHITHAPARLMPFLRIARRQASGPMHPALARAPRLRSSAKTLSQFCRIDRTGPDRV